MTAKKERWLRAYETWKASRPMVLASAAALVVIVAIFDYLTGTDFAFAIFYIIPIFLASRLLGLREGLFFSIVGALASYAEDNIFDHRIYAHPLAPYWDTLVYLCFFMMLAATTAKLEAISKRLKGLLQLKTDMLSLVSHEFGNNLTVMAAAVQYLRDIEEGRSETDPEREELYEMLERVCATMRRTSGNFLNQLRMESGVFELNVQAVDLQEVARQALAALTPLASQKGVKIRKAAPDGLLTVEADPDALALVFSNLVGNAIKYTPSGGSVTIRLELSRARKGLATVTVEDTGIGISEQEQAAVFSGFYRTKESRRAAKGAGIGLKVSRQLIEQHGMRLTVESVVGQGSRFSFNISCAPRNQSDAGITAARR
jgi:signal transduction histidine kinase